MMGLFAHGGIHDLRPSPGPDWTRLGHLIGPACTHDGSRGPRSKDSNHSLLMASGNLTTVHATTAPDLADRVAQVLQPYFARTSSPASPWLSSPTGRLRWRKATGSATSGPARVSGPTPGSTSVR